MAVIFKKNWCSVRLCECFSAVSLTRVQKVVLNSDTKRYNKLCSEICQNTSVAVRLLVGLLSSG